MKMKYVEFDPHPYGALNVTDKLSDEQIIHGINAARGIRDPTKALHKVVAIYTSKIRFRPETYEDVESAFIDALEFLTQKGANVGQALDVIAPYTGTSTTDGSMVASHTYNVLNEFYKKQMDAREERESAERYEKMFGKTGGRKRRSSRKRKGSRKTKSYKKRKSSKKSKSKGRRRTRH